MDWAHVRKVNRRASARKAKRERKAAEREAMHERLGGTVSVGELRTAKRETRLVQGGYGCPFQCEIWTFRGREWRIVIVGEEYGATPHQEWRTDPDLRQWVPLTVGARKWLATEFAKED